MVPCRIASTAVTDEDPFINYGYGQNAIAPGLRPAVLVVDLQAAFTNPGLASLSQAWDYPEGRAEMGEMIQRAVENTARVLKVARGNNVPVFHAGIAYREDGSDIGLWAIKLPRMRELTLGSRATQVDERVWSDSDVQLMRKWPSAFHGTPLASLLTTTQRDTVIVTGACTSGCVRATTTDAFSYGYRTLVPEDCVGDWGRDAHESNLRDVHLRYAEVTTSAEVIAYLEQVRVEA